MQENYQPLAFYTTPKRQYHNRYRAFGNYLPVYAPEGNLIPFQIYSDHPQSALGNIFLVDVNTGVKTNIKSQILPFIQFAERYVIYNGGLRLNIPFGLYYLEVNVNVLTPAWAVVTYTSEIINICENRGFIKLTWWNDTDFELPEYSFINFGTGFRFFTYLKTEMGKPLYKFIDTVHVRNGIPFPEELISIKQYQFEVISGEPFFDGLRTVRLYQNIIIEDDILIKVFAMDMSEVTWDDVGYSGAVTITITPDNVVRAIGTGRRLTKDFNRDFNNDFL